MLSIYNKTYDKSLKDCETAGSLLIKLFRLPGHHSNGQVIELKSKNPKIRSMKSKINFLTDCAFPSLHKDVVFKHSTLSRFKNLSKTLLAFVALYSCSGTAFGQTPGLSKFYTSLYAVNGDGTMALADGVASVYYPTYRNIVDYQDIPKLISFNTKETVSILRDNKKLAVERRLPIALNDTSYLEMGELSDRQYELTFVAEDIDPSLAAYLKDNYTGTFSSVKLVSHDTTKYLFTASSAAPASKAANRFSIIFGVPGLLPVNFSSVKAFELNKLITVEWNVENEINVKNYNIEKSKDGIHFNFVSSKDVTSLSVNKQYSWTDASPEIGTTYYRIANVNKNGSIAYSKIVKVEIGNKTVSTINAYPTVINDGVISLQFNNTQRGIYMLRLINTNGQLLFTKKINHSGGNATESIRLYGNVSKGICQLNIVGPDNNSFPSVKLINR